MLDEIRPRRQDVSIPLITSFKKTEFEQLERKQNRRFFNKERLKTLFFHIGLVLFCCMYVVFGGGVFYLIERPLEIAVKADLEIFLDEESDLFVQAVDIIFVESKKNKTVFETKMDGLIDKYQRQMFEKFDHPINSNYFKALAYNYGNYTDLWTISSAIFFTSTTIIPVGFGYITPMTSVGRIFFLFYSIIGLPLALMTLSDIGKFLCGLLFWCFNNSLHLTMFALVLLLLIYPVFAALSIHNFTDMNLVDSFHFSVSSMFTIGFGDLLPAIPFGCLIFFNVFGMTLVTISIEVLATSAIHQVHYMGRQMSKARLLAGKMVQMAQKMKFRPDAVLGLGLSQLNVFSRLGLGPFSSRRTTVDAPEGSEKWLNDEGRLRYKCKLTIAYEPNIHLDFVDF